MAKGNRKAREQALFDKVLSGKNIKWWNRNNLYFPIRRTSKEIIKARKYRLSLTNKIVKGSIERAVKDFLSPVFHNEPRKPNWQIREEKIQNGYQKKCKECGETISSYEFNARDGVCRKCWGQIKNDEQPPMQPKYLPFSGGE